MIIKIRNIQPKFQQILWKLGKKAVQCLTSNFDVSYRACKRLFYMRISNFLKKMDHHTKFNNSMQVWHPKGDPGPEGLKNFCWEFRNFYIFAILYYNQYLVSHKQKRNLNHHRNDHRDLSSIGPLELRKFSRWKLRNKL